MDPIADGSQMFAKIAKSWSGDLIPVPGDVDEFLSTLLKLTKGWVIVDLLDTANWDKIEGYSWDPKASSLYLHWHDYRQQDSGLKEEKHDPGRMLAFPGGPAVARACADGLEVLIKK
jgi:hypothetical protein